MSGGLCRDLNAGALLPGGGSPGMEDFSTSTFLRNQDDVNKEIVLNSFYKEGFLLIFLQVFIKTFLCNNRKLGTSLSLFVQIEELGKFT